MSGTRVERSRLETGLNPDARASGEMPAGQAFIDQHLGEPYAEVKRIGRWTYHVHVVRGLMSWGPDGYGWHVLGRQRAERKARHALARYLRTEARNAERITIHP